MCYKYNYLLIILSFIVHVTCEYYYKKDSCEVILQTDKGQICGRVRLAEEKYKYASFQGVPYGKPPLGKNRFKELEPSNPWNGLLDATEESPACPTKELIYGRMYMPKKGMSEDCIYLNLYIPYSTQTVNNVFNNKGNSTTRLPILVNVHGGGYESGSGLPDLHGPEYLMTKDVIVISFNYRLNVFGFLSLRSKEIPGNQGIRDQVTFLRWVKRNARYFGGDPDNVTLIGQSTGATCLHILSLSTAAQGLFHRLIILSGTAIQTSFSPEYAKTISEAFLSNLGINSTNPEDIHDHLVKLPLINIMKSFTILQNTFGTASLRPVIEDKFPGVTRILEDDVYELTAQGKGTIYPTIIGFVNHDREFFRWIYLNLDLVRRVQENHQLLLFDLVSYDVPENIQTELAESVYNFCFNTNVTLDSFVRCSTELDAYFSIKLAQWRAIIGAPVYLYQFSYESERSLVKEALWLTYDGAAHIDDFTYIFRVNSLIGDHVSFPPKNEDDRMKEWMTTIVTNFMRCSSPTCDSDDICWPRESIDKLTYQDINKPMVYQMTGLSSDQMKTFPLMDRVVAAKSRNVTERLLQLKNSQ